MYKEGTTPAIVILDDNYNATIANTVAQACWSTYYTNSTFSVQGPLTDYDEGLTRVGTVDEIGLGPININASQSWSSVSDCLNTQAGTDAVTTLPTPRSKYHEYYIFRMSLDSGDCDSNDELYPETDYCDGVRNPIRAFMVGNPASYKLSVTVWPHHDCPGYTDSKTYYQATNTLSSHCYSRKTYSWYGSYSYDECYGAQDTSNCSDSELADELVISQVGSQMYYQIGISYWKVVNT